MIFLPTIKRGKQPRRKTPRLKLAQECDALVREMALARDRTCVHCGGANVLQSAHVLPKGSNPRMRFMLLNVMILCYRCHLHWWHKDPMSAREWFEKTFPGRYERLLLWSRQMPKLDLKQIRIELKSELACGNWQNP